MELTKSFARKGHSITIAPMYMPFRMDMPVSADTPIFFGAVNTYLREKIPSFEKSPAWLKKAFNSPPIHKLISKRSFSTDPAKLEDMTISVMLGEEGGHSSELERMVLWVRDKEKHDAVYVSNALLIGIAVKMKKELGIPVYCGLDDEDYWIEKMSAPYRRRAWDIIKDGSGRIDGFISSSRYYAERMLRELKIPPGKVTVLPKAVLADNYALREPPLGSPALGFLSRMSEENGLGVLVDAFILLKESGRHPDLRLLASGGRDPSDKSFIRFLGKKLKRHGLEKYARLDPFLYERDRDAFFSELTLLSVPSLRGESFGLFMLEAMASGVPVLQPETGGYPEIISVTSGGAVYRGNTPGNLAREVSSILADPEKILRMSREGAEGVRKFYSSDRITDMLIEIYLGKGAGV